MTAGKAKKRAVITLAVFMVIIVGSAVGFRVAVGILKNKVVEALGPDSEIGRLRVGWDGLDIEGLRIRGTHGWPAEYTLRAERVTLVPGILSFFSGKYRISSITIVRPYLSVHRTKAGKILAVPSLLSGKMPEDAVPSPRTQTSVIIGHIILQDGVVELFDDTTGRHRRKIRLEQIQASVEDIDAPSLAGRSRFEIKGIVKGARCDGYADLKGWAEIAKKDSSVNLQLKSVDLADFQAYFTRAGDIRISKGALDLDLQSDVRNNRLKAPGTIVISGLELAPGRGFWGTFMGMPRSAVLAVLKDRGNKISLSFVLEGDINNPRFSFNEALSTRLAVSMADTLKVGIGGVAKGAGTLGQKGIETAAGAVKGVGSAVKNLFGSGK